MVSAAGLLALATLAASQVENYAHLLPVWFVIGLGYAGASVPSGRLLRRSSGAEDRPSLFAAQFALSHSCWLITYPVAGWMGKIAGLAETAVALSVVAAAGATLAVFLWPPEMTGKRDVGS